MNGTTWMKLSPVLAVALPLAVAIVWDLAGGPGPSNASAESGTDEIIEEQPSIGTGQTMAVIQPSSAAGLRVGELADGAYGDVPLHARASSSISGAPHEEGGDSARITVQAILGSERGNTALVNGQSYRVGDEFGTVGWRVVEISVATRSVTFEDPAGIAITCVAELPTASKGEESMDEP